MANKNEISLLQIKSIIIFQFLNSFNILEKKIKEIFKKELKTQKNEANIKKIHFYYGSKIGTYVVPEENAIKLKEIKYNFKEEFNTFTLKEIMKFNRELNIIEEFKDLKIKSIIRPKEEYRVQDIIDKLINMRNVLAHELENCNFNNTKDIIEVLSREKLMYYNYDFLMDFDIKTMDDITINIFSNLVYIFEINEMLHIKYCAKI